MTHIIVKDGRVAVHNGRVVTSAGGAPCCCGPSGCWLVLLHCNCDCIDSAILIRLTPELQAVWPLADRQRGVVLLARDGCYQWLGSTRNPPDQLDVMEFSEVTGTQDECCDGDGGCASPPPGSFPYTILGGCGQLPAVHRCVAKIRLAHRAVGYRRFETFNNTLNRLTVIGQASGILTGSFEFENGVLSQSSFTSSLRGSIYRYNGTSLPETTETWNLTSSADSPPLSALISRNYPFVNAAMPFVPPSDPDNSPQIASFSEPQNLGACNETVIQEGDDFYRQHTEFSHTDLGGARVSTYGLVRDNSSFITNELDIGGGYGTLRVTRVESPSGLVINFDEECEGEDPRIAIACDPEASPQQITYDASLLFDDAETIIDLESDQIYVPTTTPSEDEPIDFLPNPDGGCPAPDDGGDEIYWVHTCRSGTRVIDTLVPQGESAPPIRQTIGYRPGPGLVAGQGHVRIGVGGSGGCVVSVAAQPSTEVMDTEPDLILESVPGLCSRQPQFMADQRPECQNMSAGGGSEPSPTLQDPSFARELARQQGVFNCSGCGG